MSRAWWIAGIAAIPFLLSSPADAKAPPRILVLPYQPLSEGLPSDLGEQTTVLVSREVEQTDVVVVRPSLGAASPSKDRPTGDPQALAKAEAWLDRGQIQLEEGEFAASTRAFKTAIRLLEGNADALTDLRGLSEAYLWAGIALFRDDEVEEGDEMLRQAVFFDPERTLSPDDFPPIFVKVYGRARFAVLKQKRARIEVEADAGSTVRFDGRAVGQAPIVLFGVLPGRHWIRVEAPGAPPRVKTVRVRPETTLALDLGASSSAPSSAALAAIRENTMSAVDVSARRAAGRSAKADFVLFGGLHKSSTAFRVNTLLLEVQTGQVGRLVDLAFDLDLLTAEIEVFKLAQDLKKAVSAPAGPPRPVNATAVVVAPDFLAPTVRRASGSGASTVAVAPPPIERPGSLYAARAPTPKAPPPPVRREDRRIRRSRAGPAIPLGSAGPATEGPATGRDPADASEPRQVLRSGSRLVPKDEADDGDAELVRLTAPPPPETDDDDDGSLTWLWISLGVVAVAAAGTGAYFLATGNSEPDQGTLSVRW